MTDADTAAQLPETFVATAAVISQRPADGVSLRAAAGHGLVWSAAERFGGQLLAFVVFTMLARLLDKAVFGVMALANLYISFVQIFVSQGIGVALIQRRDLRVTHLDTAFWINTGAALALSSVTIIFRNQAAAFLGAGGTNVGSVLACLALTLPLSALNVVPGALLSRELKFGLLAARSLIAALIAGGVAIVAALLGAGVWSLVFQQLTMATAGTILLWSTVSWRPGFQVDRQALTDIMPFSVSIVGNDLLWLVSQRVDQGFIGRGLGVEALGSYSVSNRLVTFGVEGITGPAVSVAMPLFSGLQDDRERLRQAFLRSTALISSVALPAFVGLLLIAPKLIPLLFGAKWSSAVVPMQILCIGACFRAVLTFIHPTILSLGKTATYTGLFALYATLSALGAGLAVSHGVAAVAWAMVVAVGLAGVANFAVMSRFLNFRPLALAKILSPTLAGCAVLTVTLMGIQNVCTGYMRDIYIVAAQVGLGSSAYFASLAVLDRPFLRELRNTVRTMTPW